MHEIDAGDCFRYRMLDLQARVHLDEIELAILVEELDRAGAGIAEISNGLGTDAADAGPFLGVERRRIGLFPDLLVAPLQRTVALAEMHAAAKAVAEHLHFDVPRLLQVLLDVDG